MHCISLYYVHGLQVYNQKEISSLYNFGSYRRENTASNRSSVVSLLYLCVCVIPPHTVARQWLSKHVFTTAYSHTIEELLDVSFSIWSMSYQRKIRQLVLPKTFCSLPVSEAMFFD
jgi:hypothetical protein